MLTLAVTFLVRASLVALFLPFSAFDKVLNFDQAVAQAAQSGQDDGDPKKCAVHIFHPRVRCPGFGGATRYSE